MGMIKSILKDYYKYRNQALEKGYDIVLLAKTYDNKYYRIKQYIGQVVEIYKGNGPKDMDIVRLKFMNNEVYQTGTYLDSDVHVGDIIAIYGIFIKNGGELELQCKCGTIRVYNTFAEAGQITVSKIYYFGSRELSMVEPSIEYRLPPEKISVLEDNRVWTYMGKDIREIEENSKKLQNQSDIIDTLMTESFCVNGDIDI